MNTRFTLTAMSATIGLALSACASTGDLEARQLAYNGTGPNPCTFGGATERAVAHCARMNFGTLGLLTAINERVLETLPAGADCEDHVAAVQQRLAGTGLRGKPVYTCPMTSLDGVCHVSLHVVDPAGKQFVVDNGAAVNALYPAHVAEFEEFRQLVGQAYWFDKNEVALLAGRKFAANGK